MFSLSHLVTPPPEAFASQVQQLAIDNLTTLGSVAMVPSNPLYPLYQYGLGLEVHHYLQAMGAGTDLQVELLLGLDAQSPDQVLGFALFLPAAGAPDACTLLYLAVHSGHRRKGVGRALLNAVVQRYPHTEAACLVSTLGWFQAQGWHAVGTSGPQVVVNTRPVRTLGHVQRLDVAPLYRTLEVQQIHAYLLKQHGRRAMADAEKQRDYRLDQLERQVKQHVQAGPQ
ncbi:GNAT family N-acetyltransferase [Pseudomonas sp. Marseille-Q5115]|uniref:GNAT family N-acetyltransferase n=1 Tax=Pseudomonas sp. Marseille-Q5115 TaxID=2866593 RepID=UPI001CE3ECD6|nr:GNAT family N-acetyltransferase [Pseudomonas sp. Marseille-Q5115]